MKKREEEEEEDGQIFSLCKTITALVWAVLYCVIIIG